jgi:hypothetical protein
MNHQHPSNPRSGRVARRLAATAGCLTLLAAGTVIAEPGLQVVEECMEASTETVRLPSSPGGSLDVRSCDACDAVRLLFEGDTRYYIGKAEVSYAQLLATAGRVTASVVVCHRPGSDALTRLKITTSSN